MKLQELEQGLDDWTKWIRQLWLLPIKAKIKWPIKKIIQKRKRQTKIATQGARVESEPIFQDGQGTLQMIDNIFEDEQIDLLVDESKKRHANVDIHDEVIVDRKKNIV